MRNSGKWTEAKFNSFVKSALRAASRKWPPKYETLNEAFVGKKINPASGREAKMFICASCVGEFPASKIQIDHIEPIINPTLGFTNWDDVVNRMFCEKENLQCLCTDCHKIKTAAEKAAASKRKKDGNV